MTFEIGGPNPPPAIFLEGQHLRKTGHFRGYCVIDEEMGRDRQRAPATLSLGLERPGGHLQTDLRVGLVGSIRVAPVLSLMSDLIYKPAEALRRMSKTPPNSRICPRYPKGRHRRPLRVLPSYPLYSA